MEVIVGQLTDSVMLLLQAKLGVVKRAWSAWSDWQIAKVLQLDFVREDVRRAEQVVRDNVESILKRRRQG